MCTLINVHSSGAVGKVIPYTSGTLPPGTVLCDGTSYPIISYPALFVTIRYNFGGSGANFNVPDLRGRFIRGADPTGAHDPNYNTRTAMNAGGNTAGVGSIQAAGTGKNSLTFSDTLAFGNGTLASGLGISGVNLYGYSGGTGVQGMIVQGTSGVVATNYGTNNLSPAFVDPGHTNSLAGTVGKTGTASLTSTDSETRPINAYESFVICYK